MKTKTSLSNTIYVMLFLAALGIGYSLVKTILNIEKDNWYASLPLLIISISIFWKNSLVIRNSKNKEIA